MFVCLNLLMRWGFLHSTPLFRQQRLKVKQIVEIKRFYCPANLIFLLFKDPTDHCFLKKNKVFGIFGGKGT